MHPVIELLMARMDSNPEEFITSVDDADWDCRWGRHVRVIEACSSKEEYALFAAKLSKIKLDALHKEVMSELCASPHPLKPLQMDMFPSKARDMAHPIPPKPYPYIITTSGGTQVYKHEAYGVQVKGGTCTIGPRKDEDSGE